MGYWNEHKRRWESDSTVMCGGVVAALIGWGTIATITLGVLRICHHL